MRTRRTAASVHRVAREGTSASARTRSHGSGRVARGRRSVTRTGEQCSPSSTRGPTPHTRRGIASTGVLAGGATFTSAPDPGPVRRSLVTAVALSPPAPKSRSNHTRGPCSSRARARAAVATRRRGREVASRGGGTCRLDASPICAPGFTSLRLEAPGVAHGARTVALNGVTEAKSTRGGFRRGYGPYFPKSRSSVPCTLPLAGAFGVPAGRRGMPTALSARAAVADRPAGAGSRGSLNIAGDVAVCARLLQRTRPRSAGASKPMALPLGGARDDVTVRAVLLDGAASLAQPVPDIASMPAIMPRSRRDAPADATEHSHPAGRHLGAHRLAHRVRHGVQLHVRGCGSWRCRRSRQPARADVRTGTTLRLILSIVPDADAHRRAPPSSELTSVRRCHFDRA